MKRIEKTALLTFAFVLFAALISFSAFAEEEVKVNNIIYVLSEKTATVKKYEGSGGSVTIPEKINGKVVTKVGNQAFAEYYKDTPDDKRVTSVSLPSTVTEIGNQTFLECKLLKKVEALGVKTIGNYVFRYCDSLSQLVLSSSFKSIGEGSFYHCKNVIIYGEKGTPSEKLAKENDFKFRLLYPEAISLSGTTISKGESKNLTYVVKPSNCYYRTFEWSSENEKIVSVNSKGKVTGKKYGTAYIKFTSKYGKATAECAVTVEIPKVKNADYIDATFNGYTLKWGKISNIKGYSIQKQVNGKWKNYAKTTSNKYKIVDLPLLSTDKYRVRAYDVIDAKTYYGKYCATISASTLSIDKVTGVKYKANTLSSLTFTWDDVPDATGYQVYCYNNSSKKYELFSTPTKASYCLKPITSGCVKKFRVRAFAKVDKEVLYGPYSSSFTLSSVPKTTEDISVTGVTNSSITYKWKAVSGATGYVVYKIENGKYKKVATVSSTTYTFDDLQRNTTVNMCIKAYVKTTLHTSYSGYSDICVGVSDSVLENKLDIINEFINAYKKTLLEKLFFVVSDKSQSVKLKSCDGTSSVKKKLTDYVNGTASSDSKTYVFSNGKDYEWNAQPKDVLNAEASIADIVSKNISSASYEKDGSGFLITLVIAGENQSSKATPTNNKKLIGLPDFSELKSAIKKVTTVEKFEVTYPISVIEAKLNKDSTLDSLTITQNYVVQVEGKTDNKTVKSVIDGKRIYDYVISR